MMFVCTWMVVYLLASLTLIRFLSAVNALVSLQVISLDEAHVTHITCKRLLT